MILPLKIWCKEKSWRLSLSHSKSFSLLSLNLNMSNTAIIIMKVESESFKIFFFTFFESELWAIKSWRLSLSHSKSFSLLSLNLNYEQHCHNLSNIRFLINSLTSEILEWLVNVLNDSSASLFSNYVFESKILAFMLHRFWNSSLEKFIQKWNIIIFS